MAPQIWTELENYKQKVQHKPRGIKKYAVGYSFLLLQEELQE